MSTDEYDAAFNRKVVMGIGKPLPPRAAGAGSTARLAGLTILLGLAVLAWAASVGARGANGEEVKKGLAGLRAIQITPLEKSENFLALGTPAPYNFLQFRAHPAPQPLTILSPTPAPAPSSSMPVIPDSSTALLALVIMLLLWTSLI